MNLLSLIVVKVALVVQASIKLNLGERDLFRRIKKSVIIFINI